MRPDLAYVDSRMSRSATSSWSRASAITSSAVSEATLGLHAYLAGALGKIIGSR